jgi:hypothetical protein
MFLANTNNPGNIKIAIVTTTPFKGSGQIATISFGSQSLSGGITGVTASLINISGGAVPVRAAVTGAQTQALTGTSSPSATDSIAGSTSAATTATAPTVPAVSAFSAAPGTVSLPTDTQQANVTVPSSTTAAPPQQQKMPEAPAASEPAVAAAGPAVVQAAYTGIMERFRTYQGARTPAAMTALFQPIANTIRQEPAIAISDGKTKIRLFVDLPSRNATAPNFALTGAKMVSLKRGDGPGKWVVEAAFNKNAIKVSFTILQGNSVLEFPVTVVPPTAAVSGKEADFALFLKDSGVKGAKFDLNADGRHDYLDDYIYTAHYLMIKGAGRK